MTVSLPLSEERRRAIAALEGVIGHEGAASFGALLPTRPWREVLDAQFWCSPGVMDAYSERPRRQVHQALADRLGEDHAVTLMEFLLPMPWPVFAQLGFTSADFRP